MWSTPGWKGIAATATLLLSRTALAQTWSSCNPLSTTCPANTALGMSINVDFTQGEVNSFVSGGGRPSYGSDGVSFTVAGRGDSPQLASIFYIMFGRVEVTMKAAPGAGIVSSLVLLSDTLDEIDMEWLGSDDSEVQTNYFSKGQTTDYNRGQFNPAANNQAEFITYTIDWTTDRIVWYVGGTVVRTLTFDEAAGQYPQTPMQVKFGAWAGGDPSNPPGTIEWARGPTDYSQGPFSMIVRSAVVTDYSTGKKYTYGDQSGTWQSIRSDGGEINGNVNGAGSVVVTASAPAATGSLSPTIPPGGIIGGTATDGSGGPVRTVGPIPDGWIMTSEGKIVPVGSSTTPPAGSSSLGPSASLLPGSGSDATFTTRVAPGGTATPGVGMVPADAPAANSAVTATSQGLARILAVVLAGCSFYYLF
ncbi:concanavalin A-like lectin/glucanase domain-containing protein [Chaetomium tenue]|uniref:Concanavalin A-like lectin/glucanase domain-containing protein n=1 Tax=Chaetomium tenue TaxID=1854479 RepID=A0ACB7PSZ8_9PEZI|nr:concanavalin A-like lectin/glucanase domain-containing protein [Chaetomium globosum]